jgi:hypothetical protein
MRQILFILVLALLASNTAFAGSITSVDLPATFNTWSAMTTATGVAGAGEINGLPISYFVSAATNAFTWSALNMTSGAVGGTAHIDPANGELYASLYFMDSAQGVKYDSAGNPVPIPGAATVDGVFNGQLAGQTLTGAPGGGSPSSMGTLVNGAGSMFVVRNGVRGGTVDGHPVITFDSGSVWSFSGTGYFSGIEAGRAYGVRDGRWISVSLTDKTDVRDLGVAGNVVRGAGDGYVWGGSTLLGATVFTIATGTMETAGNWCRSHNSNSPACASLDHLTNVQYIIRSSTTSYDARLFGDGSRVLATVTNAYQPIDDGGPTGVPEPATWSTIFTGVVLLLISTPRRRRG